MNETKVTRTYSCPDCRKLTTVEGMKNSINSVVICQNCGNVTAMFLIIEIEKETQPNQTLYSLKELKKLYNGKR